MSLIVDTLHRFFCVYIVRRPSAAPALYRGAVTLLRSLRALADFDETQLLDVGLTREDVQREIRRPD